MGGYYYYYYYYCNCGALFTNDNIINIDAWNFYLIKIWKNKYLLLTLATVGTNYIIFKNAEFSFNFFKNVLLSEEKALSVYPEILEVANPCLPVHIWDLNHDVILTPNDA